MSMIMRCPGCCRNLADVHCRCGPVRADGSLHCFDKDVTVHLFRQGVDGDLLPSAVHAFVTQAEVQEAWGRHANTWVRNRYVLSLDARANFLASLGVIVLMTGGE